MRMLFALVRRIVDRIWNWLLRLTSRAGTQVADTQKPGAMEVFLDLLPNQPKNDQARENFRQMLRERFEERLPASVERIWELPPIILQQPKNDYVGLLLEAREPFVAGYFYSCVAMCGIVGERLVKDVLRAAVLVEREGRAVQPAQSAFDQLERVEINGLVRFSKEAQLLNDEAGKAADKLSQLRNSYAHARGKDSPKDAIEAIRLLHVLVEGTVSVFKDFDIKDGAFVRKGKLPLVAE